MAKHRKRNPRLESLSKQIARILHNDIQRNGPLKPSHMSPKFWGSVQSEMIKLEKVEEMKNKWEVE
jgi:hypothetical protein